MFILLKIGKNKKIDGIRYPSVKGNGKGYCYVLFGKKYYDFKECKNIS